MSKSFAESMSPDIAPYFRTDDDATMVSIAPGYFRK
jgi:hypothetical protein